MKTRNITQSSLRNDPINRRMHGFSFRIFDDEIEVQDVISPLSLNQNPISSAPRMPKCIKNTMKSNGTRNWCLNSLNFSKFQGQIFPSRRTSYLKEKIGPNRSMKRHLVIDDRDHASVDQNGAIKSHPFNQRSRAEVSPCFVCEEMRRLISCVES